MKTFRTVLFWSHLAAGTAAGIVILIMSVTGVALTYEKQMVEWADRRAVAAFGREGGRIDAGGPLSPETIVARVTGARPDAKVMSLTLRADRSAPATVVLDGPPSRSGASTSAPSATADKSARQALSLLVDPFSGRIIGEPPAQPRLFFRTMTSWHRYLAREGASRATGRSITGAANLLFLFIVLSGMYLWVPRAWKWLQFKNVLWFRGGLAPRARDFNWHNVVGIWSAVPLAIVIAGAVPISYPWASNLVYRIAGDTPPAPPAAAQPQSPDQAAITYTSGGVDGAWAAARSSMPSWRTMTTRFAASAKTPVVITVDEGYAGQPQTRTTFTIDRETSRVAKAESFQDLSAGRRLRSWLRFAHTGEIYGLAGQTVAGLVSAGGAVLVYTGLSLALRRLVAWITRRRSEGAFEHSRAA